MHARPWYESDGEIEHRFYGVFEGGGAKGVAYGGALRAMRETKCWFKGVAGASAGAITAALVACGHTPEEIEGMTLEALGKLETGVWAGLRRLRRGSGYFPSERLHTWVEERLRAQITHFTGAAPTQAVTFRQLHRVTNVELNVVAADLSRSCQVVFSHHETPNCSVADAVIASCSIPFAFSSRLLSVRERVGRKNLELHHTVVDGGVWSNFPMHVFEDAAFRAYSKRAPAALPADEVIGFLLDEEGGHPPPRGEEVVFVDEARAVLAAEWAAGPPHGDGKRPGTGARLASWLLWPLYGLGRLLKWNAGDETGRWPQPRARVWRYLITTVDGALLGSLSWVGAIIVVAVVLAGVWVIVSFLGSGLMDRFSLMNWRDPTDYFGGFVMVLISLLPAAVAILVLWLTVLGVLVNFVLLRTSRRILYGLVTTYVAGPGAPAWVAQRDNVIPLPIPRSVTTLSFDIAPAVSRELTREAHRATVEKLSAILERCRE